MSFNSIFFIFVFLPIFLLIYYMAPPKFQNPILIIGSLFFYAWGDPTYLILMILSNLFNFYMGLELERTREQKRIQTANLIFAIVVNLLILGFFKYIGFAADTISHITKKTITYPALGLPVGLSFYTFKNLSYIIDVYTKKVRAQKNIMLFAVYSMMFPHMVSGPIVRYREVQKDLKKRAVNFGRLGIGAELFIKGLVKKVFLADNLALIYTAINGNGGKLSVASAWIGAIAYSLELYFDFSGYSDMAIGLAKMLGFNFSKNFDHPYTSGSITEFWRRWHISLGSWFRDYVYIPLGGNRVGIPRQILNLCIVWGLTGLWHGASWTFVLWGLYYGALLILEKFVLKRVLDRLPKPLRILYTMFFVVIGWAIFCHTDFSSMQQYLAAMFGFGASAVVDSTALYYIRTGAILFIISILCCGSFPFRQLKKLMHMRPAAAIVVHILLLMLCTAYMIFSSYTPFLYVQF